MPRGKKNQLSKPQVMKTRDVKRSMLHKGNRWKRHTAVQYPTLPNGYNSRAKSSESYSSATINSACVVEKSNIEPY
jgi:hypothetical protein